MKSRLKIDINRELMFEKRLSNIIMQSQKTGKCQEIAEENMIDRNYYLKQLIEKKHSSKIKIITGLRRSGKSYLLGVILRQHLILLNQIAFSTPCDYQCFLVRE